MSKGTPKNLIEAIENGLNERGSLLTPYQIEIISADVKMHVKDFLAQKFGTKILAADLEEDVQATSMLKDLWNKITG